MNFTKEQIVTIAQWVNDGATLADLQARIANEMGVKMTYMDVRFLVDDLDLTLADNKLEVPQESVPAATENPVPAENNSVPAATGSVSISVDPVQQAGVIVGGNVTFSDGNSGQWMIDGQGRLGLDGFAEGYQPTPEDVKQFQILLKQELTKLGYQ